MVLMYFDAVPIIDPKPPVAITFASSPTRVKFLEDPVDQSECSYNKADCRLSTVVLPMTRAGLRMSTRGKRAVR